MKTAIMGFGNPVRSDDAVGVYVIEQLKDKINKKEKISVLDMGTAGFEVLFGLKGHSKIILVDAVINSDEPAGTIFKVPAKELIEAPKEDPMLFLHGMKWNQALAYTKKIFPNDYPEDIQVYLIAIKNTKLEVKLSDEVKSSGDRVVEYILNDLKNNKNACT